MKNYTYSIQIGNETIGTENSLNVAIDTCKKVCARRRVNVSVYREDRFGSVKCIGHAEWVNNKHESRFINN